MHLKDEANCTTRCDVIFNSPPRRKLAMRKEWTESDEVNMLAAALLASEDLTQQEIAEKLELKSSKIQRLLKKAKSKYLHQEPPRFLSHEVTDPLQTESPSPTATARA